MKAMTKRLTGLVAIGLILLLGPVSAGAQGGASVEALEARCRSDASACRWVLWAVIAGLPGIPWPQEGPPRYSFVIVDKMPDHAGCLAQKKVWEQRQTEANKAIVQRCTGLDDGVYYPMMCFPASVDPRPPQPDGIGRP